MTKTKVIELDISEPKKAILRNPTYENAMKLWSFALLGPPLTEDAPLAGLHKARVMWKGSTKQMVKESKQWLKDHGYQIPTRSSRSTLS